MTTPPPTATTWSARVSPQRDQARHSSSTVASDLRSSPWPMVNTSVLAAGVDVEADAGLGDHGHPTGAGRQPLRRAAGPRAHDTG